MRCARCHARICLGEEYVTENRQLERQTAPGEFVIVGNEILRAYHPGCVRSVFLPERMLATVMFVACALAAVTTGDVLVRAVFAGAALLLPLLVEARLWAERRSARRDGDDQR